MELRNFRILQFLHQMFNVSAFLLGRLTQAGDATDQWRDQWRRRLEIEWVVQQQDRHIEHLMLKLQDVSVTSDNN